jgi:hypothetical protein
MKTALFIALLAFSISAYSQPPEGVTRLYGEVISIRKDGVQLANVYEWNIDQKTLHRLYQRRGGGGVVQGPDKLYYQTTEEMVFIFMDTANLVNNQKVWITVKSKGVKDISQIKGEVFQVRTFDFLEHVPKS